MDKRLTENLHLFCSNSEIHAEINGIHKANQKQQEVFQDQVIGSKNDFVILN